MIQRNFNQRPYADDLLNTPIFNELNLLKNKGYLVTDVINNGRFNRQFKTRFVCDFQKSFPKKK